MAAVANSFAAAVLFFLDVAAFVVVIAPAVFQLGPVITRKLRADGRGSRVYVAALR